MKEFEYLRIPSQYIAHSTTTRRVSWKPIKPKHVDDVIAMLCLCGHTPIRGVTKKVDTTAYRIIASALYQRRDCDVVWRTPYGDTWALYSAVLDDQGELFVWYKYAQEERR